MKLNKKNEIYYIEDDFYIFGDRWISEYDKILYDKHGHEYDILEFKYIERNIQIGPRMMKQKLSAVKFSEEFEIGDIFYCHL